MRRQAAGYNDTAAHPVGRQRHAALDLRNEQIAGVLRMRLDELELRERVLENLDVISVLHLVQSVRGSMFALAVMLALSSPPLSRSRRSNGHCARRFVP